MNEKKNIIRPSAKKSDMLIIAMLLTFLFLILGGTLGYLTDFIIPYKSIVALFTSNEDVYPFSTLYTSFLGIWIIFFLVCGLSKDNRPFIGKLAINKKSIIGALIGALLGFSMNGICILFAAISGNIKLSFNEVNPGLIIFFIIIVCIQSGSEEILDRIYLYQKLRRRYNSPLFAIIGNAVFFSIIHCVNPGVTLLALLDIVVVGIFYSLIVYYYDCVWVTIMAHTLWNFTQNIIFGLPNSGNVSQYSIFKLDAVSGSDGFFYNTAFGVEGSYGAVLMYVIGIILLIIINKGKGEKNDMWAVKE